MTHVPVNVASVHRLIIFPGLEEISKSNNVKQALCLHAEGNGSPPPTVPDLTEVRSSSDLEVKVRPEDATPSCPPNTQVQVLQTPPQPNPNAKIEKPMPIAVITFDYLQNHVTGKKIQRGMKRGQRNDVFTEAPRSK